MKAPNISAWRQRAAGDLTSALHPGSADSSVPKLPSTSNDQMANVMALGCTEESILEVTPASAMPVYPVPAKQSMPSRRRPDVRGRTRARDHRRPERDATVGKIEHRGRAVWGILATGAPWLNLGVDAWAVATPRRCGPASGCVRAGSGPTFEDAVVALFDALTHVYARAAPSGSTWWSTSATTAGIEAARHPVEGGPGPAGWPAYFVGVRCPAEVIMARRDAGAAGGGDGGRRYVTSGPGARSPTWCSAGSGPCTTPASTTSRWTPRRAG